MIPRAPFRRLAWTMVALLGLAPPAAAQSSPAGGETSERATFLLLVNTDTMAVELATRTASSLSGEIVIRGQGVRFVYSADLTRGAGISRLESAFYRGTDTVPAQRWEVHNDADTVRVHTGGTTQTVVTGTEALVSVINLSTAFLEQMVQLARAQGDGETTFPVFHVMARVTTPATVRQLRDAGGAGVDSAVVEMQGMQIRLAVDGHGRILGGVVPSQRAHIVRLAAHAALTHEAPDYSAPPGAPYTAEEVSITTPAGVRLTGTLTIPVGSTTGRSAAVVTISGSGAQTRDGVSPGLSGYKPFRQIADTLGRRGIAVLRLDDRGTGGSDLGPLTATSADFADDVRAALAYLRTHPRIDGRRLALIGHSEGAFIAPMVAVEDPSLRAVVLMGGPGRPGRLVLAYQQGYAIDSIARLTGAGRDAALAAAQAATDSLAAAMPWFRFFLEYDPAVAARRLRADVLILHGEQDHQVPVAEANILAAAIRSGGNHAVTVRTYRDLNHLFVPHGGRGFEYSRLESLSVQSSVLGEMTDWLLHSLLR